MTRIASVDLRYNPKTLWFDAGELEVQVGDGVVVTTARGTEYGRSVAPVFDADEEQVSRLKSPLRPVVRVGTDDDERQAADMERKSDEALPVFRELVQASGKDMRPVSVEFLFNGDKAVFYFEAEERVDFRELVRQLAGRFHVRVDMRQIGVRDEARMIGGLGHCGQELCCKRMGGEFCPVSIRMAKEQDLSLNPQKISGLCGRLMCCLRYEYDTYKDFKSRAPKANATVQTPAGPAKVVDLDMPREEVSVRVEGEKPLKVPLADFEPPEEGKRPSEVGQQAWDEARERALLGTSRESTLYATSQLTGTDKLADPSVVRHVGGGKRKAASDSGKQGGGKQAKGGSRKARPRRSTKVSATGQTSTVDGAEQAKKQPKQQRKRRQSQTASGKQQQPRQQQGKGKQQQGKQGGQRPGQRSSGVRNPQGAPQQQAGQQQQKAGQQQAGQQPKQKPRRRRRSHGPEGGQGASGGAE